MKLVTALAFSVFTSFAVANPGIKVTAELSPAAIAQTTMKRQPESPEMKRMKWMWATFKSGQRIGLESIREYHFPT